MTLEARRLKYLLLAALLFSTPAYCKSSGDFYNILQAPSDVDKTAPTDGQVLAWNAATNLWVPSAQAGGGGAWGSITGTLSSQTDLQSALNAKKTIATGHNYYFETTGSGGSLQETAVTASRAVATDANGLPTASATTATELGYVNGVTSAIQTQIDGKQATGSYLTSVTANTPLSGSGTSGSHLVIANAVADGATLGAAAFTAADFNTSSGVVSLDYANGQKASSTQPGFSTANQTISTVGVTLDGAGSALSTGQKGYVTFHSAGTIKAWNITADTGTCTFDIWKIATGTAVPTVTNTIINTGAGGVKPALASGTAIHSTTVTNWTTSVSANDIFGFNLDTVSSATKLTLTIEIDKT